MQWEISERSRKGSRKAVGKAVGRYAREARPLRHLMSGGRASMKGSAGRE